MKNDFLSLRIADAVAVAAVDRRGAVVLYTTQDDALPQTEHPFGDYLVRLNACWMRPGQPGAGSEADARTSPPCSKSAGGEQHCSGLMEGGGVVQAWQLGIIISASVVDAQWVVLQHHRYCTSSDAGTAVPRNNRKRSQPLARQSHRGVWQGFILGCSLVPVAEASHEYRHSLLRPHRRHQLAYQRDCYWLKWLGRRRVGHLSGITLFTQAVVSACHAPVKTRGRKYHWSARRGRIENAVTGVLSRVSAGAEAVNRSLRQNVKPPRLFFYAGLSSHPATTIYRQQYSGVFL